MSDIDWDAIADEADNSARSILAECLGKVEEFDDVIVIAVSPPGKGDYVRHWASCESSERMLAMLEVTKFKLLHEIMDSVSDE